MSKYKQWRGFKDLLIDAVEQGASAVERVHLETARRSFSAVKQVPQVTEPAQNVQNVHDTLVATAYASVRAVTRAVGSALDVAIDTLEAMPSQNASAEAGSPDAAASAEEPPVSDAESTTHD